MSCLSYDYVRATHSELVMHSLEVREVVERLAVVDVTRVEAAVILSGRA